MLKNHQEISLFPDDYTNLNEKALAKINYKQSSDNEEVIKAAVDSLQELIPKFEYESEVRQADILKLLAFIKPEHTEKLLVFFNKPSPSLKSKGFSDVLIDYFDKNVMRKNNITRENFELKLQRLYYKLCNKNITLDEYQLYTQPLDNFNISKFKNKLISVLENKNALTTQDVKVFKNTIIRKLPTTSHDFRELLSNLISALAMSKEKRQAIALVADVHFHSIENWSYGTSVIRYIKIEEAAFFKAKVSKNLQKDAQSLFYYHLINDLKFKPVIDKILKRIPTTSAAEKLRDILWQGDLNLLHSKYDDEYMSFSDLKNIINGAGFIVNEKNIENICKLEENTNKKKDDLNVIRNF